VVLADLVSVSAVSLVVWAFWARALHPHRWGSSITTVIGLDGITLAMLGPHSEQFGDVLQRATGLPSLNDLIGASSFLAGSVIFLVAVLSRLGNDQIKRQKVRRLIELPAIFIVPLLAYLYLAAELGLAQGPLGHISQEEWLRAQTVIWCLVILYLQMCIWSGVRVLSRHPKHRNPAVICLGMCAGVIVALSVSIVATAIAWHYPEQLLWVGASIAVAIFVGDTTRRVLGRPLGQGDRRFEESAPSSSYPTSE
jgi:hypothetical protein